MYQIDPSRTDLAAEFKARPYGRHSAELQRILNLFRSAPVPGNYCLVVTKPHREWTLARFGPTLREVVTLIGPSFTSLEAAEWHVFKLRWEQHVGRKLELD
jgi:hypothetical protein